MLRFIEPATPASLFSISGSLAEPQAEIPGGWLLVCIAVSMTCLYQITGRRFGMIIWKVILDSVRGLGLLFHKRVLIYNEVISDVKWMRYMSSFPDHSPLLQNTHTHTHTQESQLTGTIPPPHLLLSSVYGEGFSGSRCGTSQNHTWVTLASRVL